MAKPTSRQTIINFLTRIPTPLPGEFYGSWTLCDMSMAPDVKGGYPTGTLKRFSSEVTGLPWEVIQDQCDPPRQWKTKAVLSLKQAWNLSFHVLSECSSEYCLRSRLLLSDEAASLNIGSPPQQAGWYRSNHFKTLRSGEHWHRDWIN